MNVTKRFHERPQSEKISQLFLKLLSTINKLGDFFINLLPSRLYSGPTIIALLLKQDMFLLATLLKKVLFFPRMEFFSICVHCLSLYFKFIQVKYLSICGFSTGFSSFSGTFFSLGLPSPQVPQLVKPHNSEKSSILKPFSNRYSLPSDS